MKWEDEGILLSVKPFGEKATIIEVFTPSQGRYRGLVRSGIQKAFSGLLEPGSQLYLNWNARLEEHLGVFSVEHVKSRVSQLFGGKKALDGFNSIISLLLVSLPEREPFELIYSTTVDLVDNIDDSQTWLRKYIQWELLLLSELGYGLDLAQCALTGSSLNLKYVSPKSGRAVSNDAAQEWKSKLLPLPTFLISNNDDEQIDLKVLEQGFRLTGYFLEKKLFNTLNRSDLPAARQRFVESICN
jgi:DNA repair protein RecO (recombination protein O)